MPSFLVSGRIDPSPTAPDLTAALDGVTTRPRQSASVQRARSGVAPQVIAAEPDDIVELELDDGLRLWVRAEDVARDFGLAPSRAGGDAIVLPDQVPVAGRSRGVGEWVIRGLKVFGIDIAGTITEFIGKHVEGRLAPGPGLYRCSDGPPPTWQAVSGSLSGNGPVLVFLHGTASSTDGSFGGLWDGGANARIKTLLKSYPERVLALQHRTLTESPVENARALADQLASVLPKNAEIHLVSHSRGGLIGEILARAGRIGGQAFDNDDLAFFDDTHPRDVAGLTDLNQIFARSGLRVGRFVRVACPARGTTLADGRLDRYFSVLTNIIGQLPFLKGQPIYDGLRGLLAAVLKKRTQPDELPGLEAMMPGSALTLMLNRPDVQTRSELHVLGGDIEGDKLWSRLKTFASDLFYLDDHDLVVNTPSMFGGTPRVSGTIHYWIDTGPEVTHFNYFRRDETADRLTAALVSPPGDFRHIEEQPSQITSQDYRKRDGAGPQPVVFVLPGIMGSTLQVKERSVWVDYLNLAMGHIRDISLDASDVVADALVADAYKKLVKHLALTHEVVPFPYDWRHSIENAGTLLEQQIAAKLDAMESTGQPVRIIAHSMGGLVVRAMIGSPSGKKVWERMCQHPSARFIMLGTPNGGAHAIAAMLIGRDALTRKLALLDLKNPYQKLLELIARFDGVLNLLPHAGTLDLFDATTWDQLSEHDKPDARGLFSSDVASSKFAGVDWARPSAAQLADAARMRTLLQNSPIDPARMIYVAGCADETACDVTIDPGAEHGRRVIVHATERGDGRVPWATGIPSQLHERTYYMDAVHGDLANTEEYFPALDDLLVNGVTTKLPKTPPARRSAASETFPMRAPLPSMVPDSTDLVLEAVGGSRRRIRSRTERRVRVRVVHGSLAAAESPVVVGHYYKDVLVSAESFLDQRLDGRLSELYRMDLYPGEIATAVAVLNEPGTKHKYHPGAVVVGLGNVGDLSPGSLTNTLANGLVVFGAERVAVERRRQQRADARVGKRLDLPITILLVGSTEGGVSLSDSLQAILRAVRDANVRLAAGEPLGEGAKVRPAALTARLTQVDILELFEDRAIQAQRALNRIAESRETREGFHVEETLAVGRDGETRASAEEGAGWWQRIRITAGHDCADTSTGKSESLKFEALTRQSSAPAYLQPTQRRIVEGYLDRAKGSTRLDVDLGYTLFDMLVPPPFKQFAPDRQRLAVVLDEQAARYPWELLHDRYDNGGRPLAVETGMIRQLLVTESERRLRATTNLALVIGNPHIGDPRFSPLPGAANEAGAVAKLLEDNGIPTTRLIGEDAAPEAVLEQLPRQWRILHIAAHGVLDFKFDDESDALTGVVVDNGIVLTPALFSTMTRFVPDVVFINCCHLGNTAAEAGRPPLLYHQFAANVATQFIRLGARAVVAAGWAVDDEAAKIFATTFYDAMLRGGQEFGEAVMRARQATYDGGTNTWGAYQCYGEPGFTLSTPTKSPSAKRPVAPREAAIWFENLAKKAASASSESARTAMVAELETLIGICAAAWLKDATVCAAIGAVYSNIKDFAKATDYYERALSAELASSPIRTVEQLANLVARAADASQDIKMRAKQFAKANEYLDALLHIGKTAERYAILGSLYKRQAQSCTGDEQRKALAQMAAAYEDAYKLKVKNQDSDAWYPLANHLSAAVILTWDTAKPKKGSGRKKGSPLEELLDQLRTLADAIPESSTNFWELSLGADYRLLAAIHADDLDGTTSDAIAADYALALQRGGSARDIDSVVNQVKFYEQMATANKKSALAKALAALRDKLAQL